MKGAGITMPVKDAPELTTDTPAPSPEAPPSPIVRTDVKTRPQPKVKRQPPYAVVLHNDDINGMEFVVGVLRKVFNYRLIKAVGIMLKVHVTGRGVVWTGSLEVAELKADQIKSCGPDPNKRHRGAPPLGVSVEPLPSE